MPKIMLGIVFFLFPNSKMANGKSERTCYNLPKNFLQENGDNNGSKFTYLKAYYQKSKKHMNNIS